MSMSSSPTGCALPRVMHTEPHLPPHRTQSFSPVALSRLYDVAKTYFHVTGPGDLKARRRRKGSADQGPPEVTPHSKFTLTPLDLSIGGDPKSSAWPSDDELDGHEEHSGPHRLSSMGHEMSSGIKTFLNGSVLKGLDPVLQNRLGNIFWSWVIASGVVYVASTITYPLGKPKGWG